jgi:dimethylaniline monooxygenase (N-oxide forming)
MAYELRSKVCIVGAGSSGMATAKALQDAGVAFDCFELGSDIGGMWRYENDNGLSSAYRSLHIDTSRKSLGYPGFPIPDDMPDFLSHEQVLRYLEAYVERFGLRQHILFRTEVRQLQPVGIAPAGTAPVDTVSTAPAGKAPASRANDSGWKVTLANGDSRQYRAVIVANGHLWDPRMPSFAGRFDGPTIHSHHYRTADAYEGKRVLVVGMGNSGVDIAVDLARRARFVGLSTRRSAWIMPKYIMGVPIDRWSAALARRLRLPTPVIRAMIGWLMRLTVGDQRRFGVPRPKHPIWREHATISQDLLPYLGHGWIGMRPDVRALQSDRVEFADGTVEPYDAIIYATGYRTTFPFLEPDVFAVRDGAARLYRRMHPPQRPGLFFTGLVQPVGPTIPLVEHQGRWLAALLSGRMRLPERSVMEAEIARHHRAVRRLFLDSARYTLQVDFRTYVRQMQRDVARGVAGS